MFPLSKWHAAWLALAVLVSAAALAVARRHASAPAGPVAITETAPAGATPAGIARSESVARTEAVALTGAPIYVHVSGHIARPGLYRMRAGSRVMDAITGAGGATEDADLDALNLATPLSDGQKLVVPSVGEAPPAEQPDYLIDSPPPPAAVLVRPDPPPPSPPSWEPPPAATAEPFAPAYAPNSLPSSGGGAAPAATGKLRQPGEGFVNINTASSAELQRLPGVGPSTAQKILDYRGAHGAFRTVEELMEVKGIGPKKLEKMAPFVTLR